MILNKEQRRQAGFLGKEEDPGELAFRTVCEQTGREAIRVGWRGKDEEHPGMRSYESVSKVQRHAPDFRTEDSYVEVQYINSADHIKIKKTKFEILDKWWNSCKINPHGTNIPLNWFFYDKKADCWTVVPHSRIIELTEMLTCGTLFEGNQQDEWKQGWKIPLEAFDWHKLNTGEEDEDH